MRVDKIHNASKWSKASKLKSIFIFFSLVFSPLITPISADKGNNLIFSVITADVPLLSS